MPPFRPGDVPIPQEGRLLLAVQHQRQHAEQAKLLARIALEEGQPLPVATSSTPGGDIARMRGVPIMSGRIGGAIRGTRPDSEIIAREERAHRQRLAAWQAKRIPEHSPGSQPEEALLEVHGDWPRPEATAAEVEQGPRSFFERPKPTDSIG